MFNKILEYIHSNPVTAGFIKYRWAKDFCESESRWEAHLWYIKRSNSNKYAFYLL